MKKTLKFYVICWAILLVVFHIVAFLLPGRKFSGSFWIGYVFIALAMIGQLVCAYVSFQQDNLQKFFYHVPLITISYSAAILMAVVGILCMAIPFLPAWVGAIVCLLILGFSIVSVIKARAAADIVENLDDKTKAQTFFMQSLTAQAESLLAKATNEQIKSALKGVYEVIRYSDPMSNYGLADIEGQIAQKFAALSSAVASENPEQVKAAAEDLLALVSDRNKKCKLLKQNA